MHLAAESDSYQILAYMLIQLKLSPNALTGPTILAKSTEDQVGILHLAIQKNSLDILDLIMMSSHVDLNLVSPTFGTPLHVACKLGNLKTVQRLILAGADLSIRDPKTKKLAKETTSDMKIVYLIEKYEKL